MSGEKLDYQVDKVDKKFHTSLIPRIIDLEDIERDTYKYVWDMKFRYHHPYGPPSDIPDTPFTMNYTGVTLNGKPHGMGKLSFNQVEPGETCRNVHGFIKFTFYGQFYKGEIQGGPALLKKVDG